MITLTLSPFARSHGGGGDTLQVKMKEAERFLFAMLH